MEFFERYTSACPAGSGNQHFFLPEDPTGEYTSRVFYRLAVEGEYGFALLFSNIIDSTYANGAVSHKNRLCDSWQITGGRVAVCKDADMSQMPNIDGFLPLQFSGKPLKTVAPGEFFATDEFVLDVKRGDYLCVELTFRGREIPYHEEAQIPVFRLQDGAWLPNRRMPLPGMIGCRRAVKKRLGFIGDSITQGCGTVPNSYTHYAARLTALLGDDYSCWDLGLGFGRANDAASDGAWLYKARQVDLITVCYGVNDLLQGFSVDQIKRDLYTILTTLKAHGQTVVMQTVPPFDYGEYHAGLWREVNRYIKEELAPLADGVFDVVPILGHEEPNAHRSRYGSHPDGEGHRLWAEALAPFLREVLDRIEA